MTRPANLLRLVLAVALWLGAAGGASASQWMFQPGYFAAGVPAEQAKHIPHLHGRTAYRRAYVHTAPGGSVRGGIRWNRYQIPSGRGYDTTIIREQWHEFRPAP